MKPIGGLNNGSSQISKLFTPSRLKNPYDHHLEKDTPREVKRQRQLKVLDHSIKMQSKNLSKWF